MEYPCDLERRAGEIRFLDSRRGGGWNLYKSDITNLALTVYDKFVIIFS